MTLPTTLNVPLLIAVRDHIANHPKQLNMGDWIITHNADGEERDVRLENLEVAGPFVLDALINNCGTAACIAGWATLLDPVNTHTDAELEQHSVNHISAYATWRLGLSTELAERLFFTCEWPRWTYPLSTHTTAVALLDLIIAGVDPWDYDTDPRQEATT